MILESRLTLRVCLKLETFDSLVNYVLVLSLCLVQPRRDYIVICLAPRHYL